MRVRARLGQWKKKGDMKRIGSTASFPATSSPMASKTNDPYHFFDPNVTRKKEASVQDDDRTVRELMKEEREATRKVRENTTRVAVESFPGEPFAGRCSVQEETHIRSFACSRWGNI